MLPEPARELVQELCVYGGPYTPEEGATALRERAKSRGEALTEIEAGRLSESLGYLAENMLIARDLAPTWASIRSWLASLPWDLDALRQLSADRETAHLFPGASFPPRLCSRRS